MSATVSDITIVTESPFMIWFWIVWISFPVFWLLSMWYVFMYKPQNKSTTFTTITGTATFKNCSLKIEKEYYECYYGTTLGKLIEKKIPEKPIEKKVQLKSRFKLLKENG